MKPLNPAPPRRADLVMLEAWSASQFLLQDDLDPLEGCDVHPPPPTLFNPTWSRNDASVMLYNFTFCR